MTDAIHKVLTFLTNPLTLELSGLLAVVSWQWLVVRKEANHRCTPTPILYTFFIIWLWLWSTPLMTCWIGLPLESAYPPVAVENMPEADAVCILGGGMAANTNFSPYAEMNTSADRVWLGAQLYKAGKAKAITITGGEVSYSTIPLLRDFGVPTNAVISIVGAKNTEDEARLVAVAMREGVGDRCRRTKVLLVTSAWHMRRAEWLFRKAGLDVILAACDYEVSIHYHNSHFGWCMLLPGADCLSQNSYLFKEHFAYWCYRVVDWIENFSRVEM